MLSLISKSMGEAKGETLYENLSFHLLPSFSWVAVILFYLLYCSSRDWKQCSYSTPRSYKSYYNQEKKL